MIRFWSSSLLDKLCQLWYNVYMSAYTDLCKNVAEYFENGHGKWKEACNRGDPLALSPHWIDIYADSLKHARYWRKKAEKGAVTSF